MRLLVVEDEAKTAEFLAKGLKESGFVVDVALNGLDGRYLIEQQESDLIILDVMLPGLNGWQLLQLSRQRGATPVLFLTAKDAIEDRVRGLELGADDYNIRLSHSRAESVKKGLIALGVPPQQVTTSAMGKAQPLGPNQKADGSDDPEGRSKNRRAEIFLDF